jgi:adenine-specific DNA-methyltransferase
VPDREGCLTVWPLNKNLEESRWQLSPASILELLSQGYLRTSFQRNGKGVTLEYLSEGQRRQIETGAIVLQGRDAQGAVLAHHPAARQQQAKTLWNLDSHGATAYGTQLLTALLPGREFPYPKSLYAVEDTLRFFLADKPNALVIDFFAGSGTTLHAVARLNHHDGGNRQAICVTNNEVSEQESNVLAAEGLRPGDPKWEAWGICEYITKPRVEAAITGRTPEGVPLAGDYKFTDQFPMADGLLENAEFFNLTYEDPDLISLGRKFQAVAPLLWLKAGGAGAMIENIETPWAMSEEAGYAVLFDTDQWRGFVEKATQRVDLRHVYVVTDSEATFQQVVADLPGSLPCTQLYEDYLHNFQINTRGIW